MTAPPHRLPPETPGLRLLRLEVNGRCSLTCVHCHTTASHGGIDVMAVADWTRVIDEAADLGVELIQLAGDDPTRYAALPELIGHTLTRGVTIEVHSTLYHSVRDNLWTALSQPGISLTTTWYTDDPLQHLHLTGRNTLHQIQANIEHALSRNIPLRADLVRVLYNERLTRPGAAGTPRRRPDPSPPPRTAGPGRHRPVRRLRPERGRGAARRPGRPVSCGAVGDQRRRTHLQPGKGDHRHALHRDPDHRRDQPPQGRPRDLGAVLLADTVKLTELAEQHLVA